MLVWMSPGSKDVFGETSKPACSRPGVEFAVRWLRWSHRDAGRRCRGDVSDQGSGGSIKGGSRLWVDAPLPNGPEPRPLHLYGRTGAVALMSTSPRVSARGGAAALSSPRPPRYRRDQQHVVVRGLLSPAMSDGIASHHARRLPDCRAEDVPTPSSARRRRSLRSRAPLPALTGAGCFNLHGSTEGPEAPSGSASRGAGWLPDAVGPDGVRVTLQVEPAVERLRRWRHLWSVPAPLKRTAFGRGAVSGRGAVIGVRSFAPSAAGGSGEPIRSSRPRI
jgi:hypothetical protein